jgi:hypothetical protein
MMPYSNQAKTTSNKQRKSTSLKSDGGIKNTSSGLGVAGLGMDPNHPDFIAIASAMAKANGQNVPTIMQQQQQNPDQYNQLVQ